MMKEDKEYSLKINHFIARVFFWLFVGLFLSSLIAEFILNSPDFLAPYLNYDTYFKVFIAQTIFVGYLSPRVMDLPLISVIILYIIYSCVNGYILVVTFYLFSGVDATLAIFICSVIFALMIAYVILIKKEISATDAFVKMLFCGVILAFLTRKIIGGEISEFLLNISLILIFASLTAYDFRMIKSNYYNVDDPDVQARLALGTAFSVYLGLINMLILILRMLYKKVNFDDE